MRPGEAACGARGEGALGAFAQWRRRMARGRIASSVRAVGASCLVGSIVMPSC